MSHAVAIWAPEAPADRLTVVAFRRELSCAAGASGWIELFANTHYHLHVNGALVGSGPARSGPGRQLVDRYDLTPYLRPGANVVAVLAAHCGSHSFHHLPAPAGFIAWGAVDEHDLATPGDWRCCRSRGHVADVPRWSFAIPAVEHCDERAWPAGWDQPGTASGEWLKPVAVEAAPWHDWQPRGMAALTRDLRRPRRVVRADLQTGGSRSIGFILTQAATDLTARQLPAVLAVAATWIHTPQDRVVEAGSWWGEHFCNGVACPQAKPTAARPMRQALVLDLRAGWNLVLIRYGMFYGSWECELELPADLQVDASRGSARQPIAWRSLGPVDKEILQAQWQQPPTSESDLAQLATAVGEPWQDHPHRVVPASPLRHLAWAVPGEALAIDAIDPWPIRFPAGRAASVLVDFGTVVLGRVQVSLTAPAGTVVDLVYSEELSGGRPHYTKSVVTNSAERRICAAGGGTLTWFFPRGCRYLEVGIAGHEAEVALHDVALIEMRYPYPEEGRFRCSDPALTDLWAYGIQTLRSCSEDVITDCPWRERTLYGGDLLPEAAVAAVLSPDLRLVRHSIEVFLDCQNAQGALPSRAPYQMDGDDLGEYQLVALITAAWYLRLSGDRDWAQRVLPRFRRVMQQFGDYDAQTGCYHWHGTFIEHTTVQKAGLVCAGNAILAGAWRAWAELLAVDAAADEIRAAQAQAERLAGAVAQTFWDPEAAAFRSGIGDPEAPGPSHHLHASSYAGCFACTDAEQDRELLATYRRRLAAQLADPLQRGDFTGFLDTDHSPYGTFYLLNHCARIGEAAIPESIMRRHYAPMLAHPTGTIWEQFNDTKSLCHAWSAAPTWYLSTQVLGVQLGPIDIAPLDQIVIAPMAEHIDWAEGRVPHPLGPVDVHWAVRGDQLHLAYRAPPGAEVRVEPRGRLAGLQLVLRPWSGLAEAGEVQQQMPEALTSS